MGHWRHLRHRGRLGRASEAIPAANASRAQELLRNSDVEMLENNDQGERDAQDLMALSIAVGGVENTSDISLRQSTTVYDSLYKIFSEARHGPSSGALDRACPSLAAGNN